MSLIGIGVHEGLWPVLLLTERDDTVLAFPVANFDALVEVGFVLGSPSDRPVLQASVWRTLEDAKFQVVMGTPSHTESSPPSAADNGTSSMDLEGRGRAGAGHNADGMQVDESEGGMQVDEPEGQDPVPAGAKEDSDDEGSDELFVRAAQRFKAGGSRRSCPRAASMTLCAPSLRSSYATSRKCTIS
jgi:hypothetical protein